MPLRINKQVQLPTQPLHTYEKSKRTIGKSGQRIHRHHQHTRTHSTQKQGEKPRMKAELHGNQVQLDNWQKKKPETTEDQRQVLQALKEIGPATIEEVAQHLGVPPHTISGRFGGNNELQDQDLIEVKGHVKNSRGYRCKLWQVKK